MGEPRAKPKWGFDATEHFTEPLTFTSEQRAELRQLWMEDPDTRYPVQIMKEDAIEALIDVTIYQLDFYQQFENIERVAPSHKDNKKALDIIKKDATTLKKHFNEMGSDLEMQFILSLSQKEFDSFKLNINQSLQKIQKLCEELKPEFKRKGGRPHKDISFHLIQINLFYDELDKNLGCVNRSDLSFCRFLDKSLEFAGIKTGDSAGTILEKKFDQLQRWKKAKKAGLDTEEGIRIMKKPIKPRR